MTNGKRAVLLITHAGKPQALSSARFVADRLTAAGLTVRVLSAEAAELRRPAEEVPAGPEAAAGAEVVMVVGGDGTLLRAAEVARPAGVPLLGVNLGHVGFLAEAEPDDLAWTVDRVVARRYHVERRMTIDVTARHNGAVTASTWALNEATVEKTLRAGMLEVVTEVDGRPLSRLDCDGVICATPTGSTAYAFSAGGPVVWPEVEALLLVPICAHALFAGPMVVAPASTLAVEVIGGSARTPVGLPGLGIDTGRGRGEMTGAVLWCDGRRRVELPPGSRVEVRRGARPVLLARLNRHETETEAGAAAGASFTDRLVAKFELPVTGWRGRRGAVPPRPPARGAGTVASPQAPGGGADSSGEETVASGLAAGGGAGSAEKGTVASGRAAGGGAGSAEKGTVASGRAAGGGAGSAEKGTVASGRAAGGGAGSAEEEASRADA